LIGIILLLVVSVGAYIAIGKKLRAQGQDILLREKAAQRLKMNEENKTQTDDKINQTEPNLIRPEDVFIPIPAEDLTTIKTIFGIDTFFATETISYQAGAIFKGNLRGDPEKVHQELTKKLESKLAQKYRLFLVESPEEKPVIVILPSSNDPKVSGTLEKVLALVLLIVTIFTTLEASGLLLGFDLTQSWSNALQTLPLSVGIFVVLFLIGRLLLSVL
jgi:hypothetical protein